MTARPRDEGALDAPLSVVPARVQHAAPDPRDSTLGAAVPAPALPRPRLTRAQEAYALARAEGLSMRQSGVRAGVTWRAVKNWRLKPALRDAIEARTDELTAERVRAAKRHLAHHTERAARVLVQLLDHEDGDVRRKAAAEVARLGGLLDTTGPRHRDAGPRIVIQRAVLALTSGPDPDGTPQDGG